MKLTLFVIHGIDKTPPTTALRTQKGAAHALAREWTQPSEASPNGNEAVVHEYRLTGNPNHILTTVGAILYGGEPSPERVSSTAFKNGRRARTPAQAAD